MSDSARTEQGGEALLAEGGPAEPEEPLFNYCRMHGDLEAFCRAEAISCAAVHSSRVIVGSHSGTVAAFEWSGAAIARAPLHTKPVRAVAIESSGDIVVSGAEDGVVTMASLSNPADVTRHNHEGPIRALAIDPAFSAAHRRIAAPFREIWLRLAPQSIWAMAGSRSTNINPLRNGPIAAVAWRGSLLAAAFETKVEVYDLQHKGEAEDAIIAVVARPHVPVGVSTRPALVWESPSSLLVGWEDELVVLDVLPRDRVPRGERRARVLLRTALPGAVCGVAPFGRELAVLLWGDGADADAEEDEEGGAATAAGAGEDSTTLELLVLRRGRAYWRERRRREELATSGATAGASTDGAAGGGGAAAAHRPLAVVEEDAGEDADAAADAAAEADAALARPAAADSAGSDEDDEDGGEEGASEVSCDTLPLRGMAGVPPHAFHLVSDTRVLERHSGLPVLAVVAPRDVVLAQPRSPVDRVRWLLDRRRPREAVAVAEACERRGIHVPPALRADATDAMLRSVLASSSPEEVAGWSRSLLGAGGAVAWEGWARHVMESADVAYTIALARVLPTKAPRLAPDVYEAVLAVLMDADADGFLGAVQAWAEAVENPTGAENVALYRVDVVVRELRRRLAAGDGGVGPGANPTKGAPPAAPAATQDKLLDALAILLALQGHPEMAFRVHLRRAQQSVRAGAGAADPTAHDQRDAQLRRLFALLRTSALVAQLPTLLPDLLALDTGRALRAAVRERRRFPVHAALRAMAGATPVAAMLDDALGDGGGHDGVPRARSASSTPLSSPRAGYGAADSSGGDWDKPEGVAAWGEDEAAAACLGYCDRLLRLDPDMYNCAALGWLPLLHLRLAVQSGAVESMEAVLSRAQRLPKQEALVVVQAATAAAEARADGAAAQLRMHRASAGLLADLGRDEETLAILLDSLGDVEGATRLVARRQDEHLWAMLIDRCASATELLASLLQHAEAVPLSPAPLIAALPESTVIPGLCPALLRILRSYAREADYVCHVRNVVHSELQDLEEELVARRHLPVYVPDGARDLRMDYVITGDGDGDGDGDSDGDGGNGDGDGDGAGGADGASGAGGHAAQDEADVAAARQRPLRVFWSQEAYIRQLRALHRRQQRDAGEARRLTGSSRPRSGSILASLAQSGARSRSGSRVLSSALARRGRADSRVSTPGGRRPRGTSSASGLTSEIGDIVGSIISADTDDGGSASLPTRSQVGGGTAATREARLRRRGRGAMLVFAP